MTDNPDIKPRSSSGPAALLGRIRTRRGSAIGIALALLVSAVSIFAAAHFRRTPPPPPARSRDMQVTGRRIGIAPDAPQWQMLKLGRAEPAHQRWSDPVPAYVEVDETEAARVGAPLGGRVVQVFAELGQPVEKGAPLFSVASPDLAVMSAERAKARVDLDAAKATESRVQAIVSAHALPAKEEVAAEQHLRQAEVDYRVAQAKLSSLQVSTRSDNEFVVTSPRAGNVVEKNVLPGQQIGAADAGSLMMVADLSSVWVVAQLFEANAGGIKVGTPARITVESLPGVTLNGKVDMVSAVVDPVRHSVPVRVRLDNKDGRLKPNTYARMSFLADVPEGSVEVASSSLVSDGATQYVYVRGKDGRFGRRKVVAGAVRDGHVLITAGLQPGETVVERGAILLDNQIALSE